MNNYLFLSLFVQDTFMDKMKITFLIEMAV